MPVGDLATMVPNRPNQQTSNPRSDWRLLAPVCALLLVTSAVILPCMTPGMETLPLETGWLGNFEARMLRNFRATVDDWEEVCSSLGPWESSNLAVRPSEAATKQHLEWVTELLSWGELVREAISHPAFPEPALVNRLDARLRHLRDKLAIWHAEMKPADEERILKAAFP